MRKRSFHLACVIMAALALGATVAPDASMAQEREKRYLVVIDAGHGGYDPGAIGYYGTREKDINLNISQLIWMLSLSDPEVEVVLTRTSDRYIKLSDRTDLANRLGADLFIAVHANAHPRSRTTRGVEVLVADDLDLPTAKQNRSLAGVLQRQLLKKLQELPPVHSADRVISRGVKEQMLFIRWAQMPAALVEVGFLTNPLEELKIRSFRYQWMVAEAILAGIKAYMMQVPAPR